MFIYDFQLLSGDQNKGTVYLPDERSEHLPVIIYCHGWGGSRKLWLPTERLCDEAMKANMAVVTFDFFGCGETGGDYSLMTYKRWMDNLSDIFSWCMTQPFAHPEKIGCYSFSSGTTAALRLAAKEKRLAFVISVATCISAHIGMATGGPAKNFTDHFQELLAGGTREFFGVNFGAEFFIDTVSNAPIHSIRNIQCPALFLQGLADNPYRCADASMAYQMMKRAGRCVKYYEFLEGNHELENVIAEVLPKLFGWLKTVI